MTDHGLSFYAIVDVPDGLPAYFETGDRSSLLEWLDRQLTADGHLREIGYTARGSAAYQTVVALAVGARRTGEAR